MTAKFVLEFRIAFARWKPLSMVPSRPPGSSALPRPSGVIPFAPIPTFEAVRKRVLAKVEDRIDLSASKRMPPSLLRQSLRQFAEQTAEQEGRGWSRPDRDRLVDEVLAEVLGYGPLEELFADATVREVMVVTPTVVIVRRDQGHWLPTSVHFRDEAHVRAILDKIARGADPIGPITASVAFFDMRLPNGFRALAVIPPDALDQSATVSFLRELAAPVPTKEPGSGSYPGLSATGSASSGTVRVSPRPGSGSGVTSSPLPPDSRNGPIESFATHERDPIARYRQRILERLWKKMARHRIYDVQKVETAELRKIVAAYIVEYCENEKIYLSDTDQGRLLLEIMTAMGR